MFFLPPPQLQTFFFIFLIYFFYYTNRGSPGRLEKCISTGSTDSYQVGANSLRPSELSEAMRLWSGSVLEALDVQAHMDIGCRHSPPYAYVLSGEGRACWSRLTWQLWPMGTCGMSQTATRGSVMPPFLPCNSFPHCVLPFSLNTRTHSCSMHGSVADTTLSNGPAPASEWEEMQSTVLVQ